MVHTLVVIPPPTLTLTLSRRERGQIRGEGDKSCGSRRFPRMYRPTMRARP